MSKSKDSKFFSFFNFFSKSYKISSIDQLSLKERVLVGFQAYQVVVYAIYLFIVLILLLFFLFGYTPLKTLLPQNVELKKGALIELMLAVDSLESDLDSKYNYIAVLKKIIQGENLDSLIKIDNDSSIIFENLTLDPSKEDSILRELVQGEDLYNIPTSYKTSKSQLEDLVFFSPVEGFVIDSFSAVNKHFGVDIATNSDEAIKATLDGVVLLADWSILGGHTMLIQHPGGVISIYMHASSLTKRQNNLVRSGEVIGIVGNSGETSFGPHLHFELWENGSAINPVDYIDF